MEETLKPQFLRIHAFHPLTQSFPELHRSMSWRGRGYGGRFHLGRKGRKEVKWDFKKGDKMFKDWKKNETKSGDFEENDSDDEEEDKKKKKKVEEESEEQDDEHDGDGDESQLVIWLESRA
ncbi:hypothetical protein NC653_032808 [Populus alba x Populus x berolinensis]|uniref:Uncharacterized protein n=1 Tax=Populus alba x Populus x berolinensis TaxID=444605 RepID=A0AAD6PZG9_9ROSI|nr:hypothetical protein NC653_032025 [Populus alba x Populus x berolinensis]KAJ6972335.1 hypothetical protein NC653_032803 [Populus alba x Populus x berolinensis]KAJ6972340.1 hypothetical protein NC653_032808 [Populus alba x Populus x berolinensis]